MAGNVAAIFVSRLSTALHGNKEERYWLTSSTLFFISAPILILFLGFVYATGQAGMGVPFAISYVLLVCAIMLVALAVAYKLTFWLWQRDYDPDIKCVGRFPPTEFYVLLADIGTCNHSLTAHCQYSPQQWIL